MTRLLLVEDNELNRDMLSRRLTRKGYDVEGAADGLIALEMVKKGHYDLVLMDMSLPGMDGWEATRHIKSGESSKNLPVIALTAHAMATARDEAFAAGCDEYDTKPIELPRLLNKIEALLLRDAS